MLRTSDKRLFMGQPLSTAFGPGTLERARPWLAGPLPPVPGYIAWYDAADPRTITRSDGLVTEWADKSGNGADLTPTGGASPPFLGLTDLDMPAIQFRGGTASGFAGTVDVSDRTFSAFAAVCVLLLGDDRTIVGCDASGGNQFTVNSTGRLRTLKATVAELAVQSNATITVGTPVVVGQVLTATDITHYANATSETDSDATAFTASRVLRVGQCTPTASDSPMAGWIGEILIYDTSLSSGDALATIGYLRNRWGIA